ncbi:hypothetical protein GWK48_06795 [Metallosphaera tengchongensis]|uniref:Ribbon-helix-helix protein, CopG family n=1 Tax=Metallosphaera tengchongensis TaxID=1532350 RepID=A0A6N0NYE1_9CREN|nr:hypothetical protein [Metallosphaera tengchongensis]QKR00120.1 hypothetical protein GWK48_06795 [Metallosphaera tengchongensis]
MKVRSFKVEKSLAEQAWEIVRRRKTSLSSEIRKRVERIIDENIPIDDLISSSELTILTLKIPDDLDSKIEKYLTTAQVKRSELFRKAIRMMIEEEYESKDKESFQTGIVS